MRHSFIGNSYDRATMVTCFGEDTVFKLERENCEPTNRLIDDEDETVEYTSSIKAEDVDGHKCIITAYYYQNINDVREEDLGNLNWEIDDYGIDRLT